MNSNRKGSLTVKEQKMVENFALSKDLLWYVFNLFGNVLRFK